MRTIFFLLMSFIMILPTTLYAKTPKLKMAVITDMEGREIKVNISSDSGDFNRHIQLSKFVKNKVVPCVFFNLRSNCNKIPKENFKLANVSDVESYIFVNPIPLITQMLALDENFNSDTENIKTKQALLKNFQTEKRYEKILTAYDSYIKHNYIWDYEDINNVLDGDLALQSLEKLSTMRVNRDCLGSDYDSGDFCAGIFKYKTDNGYIGHVYCAYTHAETVYSPPFNCVAFSIIDSESIYLASYYSPFFGEGFGAGIDGLECFIPKVTYNQESIEAIKAIFQDSRLGLSMQSKKTGRNNTLIYGERTFRPSNIIKNVFEHTTSTMAISNEEDGVSIIGSVVLTLNNQNVRDRKSFLEPDDQQVAYYKEEAMKDLNQRLAKHFHIKSRNICHSDS